MCKSAQEWINYAGVEVILHLSEAVPSTENCIHCGFAVIKMERHEDRAAPGSFVKCWEHIMLYWTNLFFLLCRSFSAFHPFHISK